MVRDLSSVVHRPLSIVHLLSSVILRQPLVAAWLRNQ
jgi:hypothetical protein